MTARTDQRLERGQRTRERLIQEGVRLFAQKGFEGVSVRELAAASDANPAAVSFHFGGKSGLYAAVTQHVADTLAAIYADTIGPGAALPDGASPEQAAQALREMVSLLAARILTVNRSLWMSLLIQREIIAPGEAFERIFGQAILPVAEVYARAIAAARGVPPDALEARTLAYGLFAMVSALSRGRAAFLRWTGLGSYTPESAAEIARIVSDFALSGVTPRKD
ncbi:MAG: CerR family C-terminal domain-containing protein [Thermodesulfobacteriota bacterium]